MPFSKLISWCVLSLSLALGLTSHTHADQHAIIIGVADYPHLDQGHSLVGPKNDTRLISTFLESRDFPSEHITILADDQPAELLPDKSNILRVLNQRIDASKTGDFLYLHFSGHGSQQPDSSGDEIDGLNEIFLPRDTKQWDGTSGTVVNAITDDEIANLLKRFEAKGVFVWLVFDSCHSGTMTRSTWRGRKLSASALGIPKTRSALPQQEPNVLDTSGGYVAFFAAQTNEETPEMKLPKRAQSPQVLGLFTYQIIEAMRQNPSATYRQIADQVMQNYQAQPWYGSTPMFIGRNMDRRVFGNKAQATSPQWPINDSEEGWEIPAGYLEGINEGAIFQVLAKPTDDDKQAIGTVSVTESHATFSRLTPDSEFSRPNLAYARLKDRGMQLGLDLALVDNPDYPMSDRAKKVLAGFNEKHFRWVADDDPADVRFIEIGRQLVLLTDGEALPCQRNEPCDHPNRAFVKERLLGNPKTISSNVKNHLVKINKALNLMRLGTVLGLDGLETQLLVTRSGSGRKEQFGPSDVPTLFEGDSVSLLVGNYLEDPLDITILFVGSDYGINLVFPRGNNFNRFMLEEERVIPLGKINTETTGLERLVIIATKASKTGTPTSYAFLAQPGITRSRSTSSTPLMQLFQDAGFGQLRTRSANESFATQGDIHTISWVTEER